MSGASATSKAQRVADRQPRGCRSEGCRKRRPESAAHRGRDQAASLHPCSGIEFRPAAACREELVWIHGMRPNLPSPQPRVRQHGVETPKREELEVPGRRNRTPPGAKHTRRDAPPVRRGELQRASWAEQASGLQRQAALLWDMLHHLHHADDVKAPFGQPKRISSSPRYTSNPWARPASAARGATSVPTAVQPDPAAARIKAPAPQPTSSQRPSVRYRSNRATTSPRRRSTNAGSRGSRRGSTAHSARPPPGWRAAVRRAASRSRRSGALGSRLRLRPAGC